MKKKTLIKKPLNTAAENNNGLFPNKNEIFNSSAVNLSFPAKNSKTAKITQCAAKIGAKANRPNIPQICPTRIICAQKNRNPESILSARVCSEKNVLTRINALKATIRLAIIKIIIVKKHSPLV